MTAHRKTRLLVSLVASGLLTVPALAAPPDVTVQLRDEQSGGSDWTDLAVSWDDNPVFEVAPHTYRDDDTKQDWYIPVGEHFFHFWFTRTKEGTYALRWCYGKPSAQTVWSPIERCTILFPAKAAPPAEPSYPPSRLLRVAPDSPDPQNPGASQFLSSIQAAIEAARDGDTIEVQEGRYIENINFRGKAVTLRSEDPEDPAVVAATIIDGGGKGSAVTFNSGEGADSVISGFTITNGREDWGGGVFCDRWTVPTIRNNRIVGNTALEGGGGIYCAYSAVIFANLIAFNHAEVFGGGIFADVSSWPLITSNFIVSNSANWGGGIFCASFCSGRIVNNTIADNSAPFSGGGLYCDVMGMPETWNCIFWGNGDDIFGWGGNHCCVEDTGNENEGINNIHQDPRFVNPARGNYHLRSSSPCIAAGAATAPSLPLTDFDGEPIPFSSFPDIGADEFVDSDGDTLPDFWERKWFGDLSQEADDDPDSDHLSNANEVLADTDPLIPDTDGDGCLDGVEFFAETDPLDPDSFFKIVKFSLSEPQVTLRWTTVPGRWYQTYFSDDFLSWQAIGAPLKATGDSLQSTLTAAKSISVRFFTVKVLP